MIDTAIESIALQIETIANVGIVHRYERLVKDWEEFVAKCRIEYMDGPNPVSRARWWIVTRTGVPTSVLDGTGTTKYHEITIRGHEALCDSLASEIDFQNLVDEVMALWEQESSFEKSIKINDDYLLSLPARSPRIGLVQLGGITCHYAEIILTINDRKLRRCYGK